MAAPPLARSSKRAKDHHPPLVMSFQPDSTAEAAAGDDAVDPAPSQPSLASPRASASISVRALPFQPPLQLLDPRPAPMASSVGAAGAGRRPLVFPEVATGMAPMEGWPAAHPMGMPPMEGWLLASAMGTTQEAGPWPPLPAALLPALMGGMPPRPNAPRQAKVPTSSLAKGARKKPGPKKRMSAVPSSTLVASASTTALRSSTAASMAAPCSQFRQWLDDRSINKATCHHPMRLLWQKEARMQMVLLGAAPHVLISMNNRCRERCIINEAKLIN